MIDDRCAMIADELSLYFLLLGQDPSLSDEAKNAIFMAYNSNKEANYLKQQEIEESIT